MGNNYIIVICDLKQESHTMSENVDDGGVNIRRVKK